ncbi:MAG: hypothetical protein ACRDZ8_18695, partial [Acidimicrobiales bacterium]
MSVRGGGRRGAAALWLVVLVVVLAGCGSGGTGRATATRPTTDAKLMILSPTPNEVTGPDITLQFEVIGGTVLPPAQATGPLRG